MPEETAEEKTEQPTPRKKEEAKKKGEVAKSRELPSVAVIVAGMLALTFFGGYMFNYLQIIVQESYALIEFNELEISDFLTLANRMVEIFILIMAPVFAAILIAAVFSNIMQVGVLFTPEAVTPKLSKLDPIKGLGRLFSKQAFMELFKCLLKLAIVGGVAFLTVKSQMKDLPLLGHMEVSSIILYILKTIFKILIRCTLAMIFLVIIDYAFQKWETNKKLKMSKKELKEEHKRTEGDPIVKSRIRSIQTQMARKRMMQEVPDADVVITNPTHIAVALKYENETMNAPKLIAKGAEKIAEKIRELAEENDVPVVENRELARSLYSLVETGREIPAALYQAVAEVLAYIYRLKGNYAGPGGY